MKTISMTPGSLKGLKSTASALSLTLALASGLGSGPALSDDSVSSAKPDATTETADADKTTAKAVTVHQAPPQSAQVRKTHDFWRSMYHNRKVAWLASDLEIPTDMVETENQVRLFAEVPGFDQNTLDVTVSRDTVTIKGAKRPDTEQKAEDFRRIERAYGSFEKTVQLTAAVDSDGATATLKDGLLTILLPKSAGAQNEGKKLSIRRE